MTETNGRRPHLVCICVCEIHGGEDDFSFFSFADQIGATPGLKLTVGVLGHQVNYDIARVPLSAGMPVVIGLFYGIIGLFYIEYTPRWCVCLCQQVCR